jgi:hypothetical protein
MPEQRADLLEIVVLLQDFHRDTVPEVVRLELGTDLERLLDEARRLGREDRARIVVELLATLEPDTPSGQRGEGEWVKEVERRARAALDGSPAISWTEACAQIRGRLSNR